MTTKEQIELLLLEISKLKRKGLLFLIPGTFLHLIVYLLLCGDLFRWGYLLTIAFTYLFYAIIMFINFYLKGSGILKDTGPFGGLPG